MSLMTIPLAEVDASVSRPVIFEIARQVMYKTNIPLTTKIIFKDKADSVFQPGSEIGSDQVATELQSDEKLYIEIQEQPLVELSTDQDLKRDNTNIPLFEDDKLGIVVLPIRKQVEVVINFRYKSNSKTYSERWKNNIWTKIASQQDLDVHTVSYSYPFPPEFFDLIKYFHLLRERVAGYGETFEKYFNDNCDQELTQVSNLSGSNFLIYKPETLTRVIGWYDFQGEPEKAEKDSDGNAWISEFSYKFRYEKPTDAVMHFPVAIHNQLVDKRLFGKLQQMLNQKRLKYTKVGLANRAFETDFMLEHLTKRYPTPKRLPEHDDINYYEHIPHTRTLFTAIIELDDPIVENNTTKHFLLNLKELGDYKIDDDVLEYIQQEGYKWMPKPYACLLNISLYRNDHLTDPKNLVIDSNLNVFAVSGVDIRKINRIRISYYSDIEKVMPEALVRLNNYRQAFIKLVKAGDTKATSIYRLKPRVDLTWMQDSTFIGESTAQEIFYDYNRVLDRATVQLSHHSSRKK